MNFQTEVSEIDMTRAGEKNLLVDFIKNYGSVLPEAGLGEGITDKMTSIRTIFDEEKASIKGMLLEIGDRDQEVLDIIIAAAI